MSLSFLWLLFPWLQIVFKSKTRLGIIFQLKYYNQKDFPSDVVFNFHCGCANMVSVTHLESYIHFLSKMFFYGKKAFLFLCEDLLSCYYPTSFDDFSILAQENQRFFTRIEKNLLIMRDQPSLGKTITSALLYLFPSS